MTYRVNSHAPSLCGEQIKVAAILSNSGRREDHHPLFHEHHDFVTLRTYSSAPEAITDLPRTRPRVVLIDVAALRKPVTLHIKALKDGGAEVLLLGRPGGLEVVPEALRAGANGCIWKKGSPEYLAAAIREIAGGGAPFESAIARELLERFRKTDAPRCLPLKISSRESEILALLAAGCANKEIAQQLEISFDTVRTHLKHLYEKLGVRSRTEAVARYFAAQSAEGSGSDQEIRSRRSLI